MRHRIITILSLLILAGTATASVSAVGTFGDVSNEHPNKTAIDYVKEQGIVSGYSDGTFKPDNRINRAEFTKIIVGAVVADIGNGKNCFSDVKDEWFAKYLCKGKEKGFISGYPNGSFGPGSDINFAEAAKIIANAFGQQVPATDPWYKGYVEKLAGTAAIPTTIGSFDHKLTRGEMAEIVYRMKAKITNLPSKNYQQLSGNTGSSIEGTISSDGSSGNNTETVTGPGIYVDYDASYLSRAAEGDVVLFFHAPWCPHCKETNTDILNNKDNIPGNVTILKVDYDSSKDLRNKYGVTYQHTFVQVDSTGNKLKLWVGSKTLSDILKQVQ